MAEGPELLSNGDFATDFSSWTSWTNGSGGGASRYAPGANMTNSSGFLFIPPPTPNQPATSHGYQSFTVTVDTDYKLRYDVDAINSPTAPTNRILISTVATTPLTSFIPGGSSVISSTGAKELDWTSPSSGTTLYVKHQMTGLSSGSTRTDNYSIKEQGVAGDFRPIIMFY
jgi:hypothetical protein